MREKSAHCSRRDSNLYLWNTRPSCFRLHHDGRHASRQSKRTLQTLTRQLDRETIMHETLQLLSVGPRRQASARTSAESDEACQRKTKDRADGMREKKCPLPSTGFEPVPLGYAPTVLPITPRWQARLPSVETNTSLVCVCVTMKKSARRMASTTSDTGDTSSKQQQAQRKENYNKRKRPISSVDHCHAYRRKKRREAVY